MFALQHIEFLHTDHFENHYHRVPPPPALSHFIDFFWETKFNALWKHYPKGFSDAQFPNIGYTNIINLGTPYIMQIGDKKFSMKTDCFLPRYNAIECFHKQGNHLFGIKFRITPVILEKKINFSEYTDHVFPLSYLLNHQIIKQVKTVLHFEERISILTNHFTALLNKYEGSLQAVNIVSNILDRAFQQNAFSLLLEKEAAKYKISTRTLQRYFESCTGIGSKQALQIMRIRKATAHLLTSPDSFSYSTYNYYDHSHFYKHLREFLQKTTLNNKQQHLALLSLLHKPRNKK